MQKTFEDIREKHCIDPDKPIVWVSGCVLGHEVRFDGGHKAHNFITKKLSETVNLIPLCPEYEAGLGKPRESIKLVQIDSNLRAIGNRTHQDHTGAIENWGTQFLSNSKRHLVNGVILKKGSPSCGLERVRVYPNQEKGAMPKRDGRGLFAKQLTECFPDLATTEEGWLNDGNLKERFLVHVFTDFRFQKACNTGQTKALIEFHAAHKFLFMAYDPMGQKKLGRILAQAGRTEWEQLINAYRAEMCQVFKKFPNRGRYTNALQHMAGYLKDILPHTYRHEMANAILKYANNTVGLEVPLSLIRHHTLNPRAPKYLKKQVYLSPYPVNELYAHSGVR